MSTVKEILKIKGTQVFSIGKDATVLNAAIVMNEHGIGALVVLDQGQVVGLFTERDIVQRVVGKQRDPARTTVAEVMTTEVACCRMETPIDEARGAIKNRRLRHLPVINDAGGIVGLISIGDLNAYEAANQEQTIHLLNEYIYGRV